jgi:uncharacterized protein YbjT (DUF2867 family)
MDSRPVLVVGASGQLGTRIVQRLVAAGRPVRAMVRPTALVSHLHGPGVELVVADLMEPETLEAACRGAGPVIATANAVAPTHGSTFEAVDDRGYASLIDACARNGCGRFVLISVPVTPHDSMVPLFRTKRLIEERLAASQLEHAILRAGPFMDEWFALIGSALPARGDAAPLIRRRWPFLQRFVGATGQLIDRHGIALVPGGAATRHAFIAIEDVAAALIAAVDHPALRNATRDLAGPEMLSWGDVAAVFAEVLGRKVRVLGIPGAVFRLQQVLMQPFSVAAANIMGLNWLASQTLPVQADGTLALLGVSPISARSFLHAKATQDA